MSIATEVARIRQSVAEIEQEIAAATAPRSKSPLSDTERRTVRSDLRTIIQRLDELTSRLGG